MDSSSSFATLQETIANLYRIPTEDREHMEIHYTDDEGDKVIISSDIELKEALYLVHQFPQPSFRLTLTLKTLRPSIPAFTASTPIPTTSESTANISQRILKLIGTGKQEDLLKAKNILLTEVPNSPEYRYLSECVEWFLNHPEEAGSYLLTALNTGLISLEQFWKNPFFANTWNQFTSIPSYLNTWLPTAMNAQHQPPPQTIYTPPFPYSYVPPNTSTNPCMTQPNPFPVTTPFMPPFMPHQPMTGSFNFTPFIFTTSPAYPTGMVPPFTSSTNQTSVPPMSPPLNAMPTMSPPFSFPPFSPRNVPLSPPLVPSSPPTELPNPVTEFPKSQSPQAELPKSPSPPVDDFVFPTPPTTQPQPTSTQTVPAVQFTSELGRGWGLGNWLNNVLHTPPTVQQNNDPDRFQEQLKTLEEMGWYDKEESLKALDKTNGDVLKAVEFLLSNQTSTVTI
jgi:hypothetical protein